MLARPHIRPLIIVLVILIAAALVAGWYNYTRGQAQDWEGLAKHLTEQGVVEYGAFWCNHCKKQKEMFGSAFQYMTYIESSTPDGKGQTEAAKAANITGYPTWVFPDGSRVVGVMTYEQLAQKSRYQPTTK